MLADSPSRLKNFIWPHEDDPKERLLLDPIPQEEMNQIMLKPMLKSQRRLLAPGRHPGGHRGGLPVRLLVLHDALGHGHRRHPASGRLGPVHRHLRLLDRYQPQRHVRVGHPAGFQRRVPPAHHPRGRVDDQLLADLRRPVPHHPPGPRLGRLLDGADPQPTRAVGQLPVAAGVGLARHHHLSARQHHLRVSADDPRPGDDARSHHRLAACALQADLVGLARAGIRVALPAQGHQHLRFCDHPDHVLGAHDRVVGLRDGAADRAGTAASSGRTSWSARFYPACRR